METKIGGVQAWSGKGVSRGLEKLPFSRFEGRGEYANARCGLFAIILATGAETIWLPDYLCETLLFPAQKLGKRIRFYSVNKRLGVEEWDWLTELGEGDLVVVIRYFGQSVISATEICKIGESGGIVVEDMSQALFSSPFSESDFAFYSLRKFLSLPDGGIALDLRDDEAVKWKYDDDWSGEHVFRGLEAIAGRRRDEEGASSHRDWFGKFKKAEEAMPTGLVPMSEVSQHLLREQFDYCEILEKRCRNSEFLMNELQSFRLFEDWSSCEPSVGFPVLVQNRDEVQKAMFSEEIFPPIHWKLPKEVPKGRWNDWLSSRILTIPADHRYDLSDMGRVVNRFLSVAKIC